MLHVSTDLGCEGEGTVHIDDDARSQRDLLLTLQRLPQAQSHRPLPRTGSPSRGRPPAVRHSPTRRPHRPLGARILAGELQRRLIVLLIAVSAVAVTGSLFGSHVFD
jgi:hypothetical protein